MPNAYESVDHRRRQVARLSLRGATQREIATALEVSKTTVTKDLQKVRQAWRQEAGADFAAKCARHQAEIGELKREAWKAGDLRTVLRGLEAELRAYEFERRVKEAEDLERRIEELEASLTASSSNGKAGAWGSRAG